MMDLKKKIKTKAQLSYTGLGLKSWAHELDGGPYAWPICARPFL
jgi:hypothetical protein